MSNGTFEERRPRWTPPQSETLIGCGGASQAAYDACIAAGRSEAVCRVEAREAFESCMRRSEWLRRLGLHGKQEALEKMLGEDEASARLWKQIFRDSRTAMIFSKHLAEAFREANIKLAEGETFGCVVFAGQRPEYVSSVVPEAEARGEGGVRLFQVLAPDLMEPVMAAVERDRFPKG
jgi:hypothetical protein